MAYSVTVTRGGHAFVVEITGTSIATTTEATITGVPKFGKVRRLISKATYTTATTIDPILGTVTNPSGTADVVVENGTAAAGPIDLQQADGAYYYAENGTLYYRDVPDSGADTTTDVILLIEDWGTPDGR